MKQKKFVTTAQFIQQVPGMASQKTPTRFYVAGECFAKKGDNRECVLDSGSEFRCEVQGNSLSCTQVSGISGTAEKFVTKMITSIDAPSATPRFKRD